MNDENIKFIIDFIVLKLEDRGFIDDIEQFLKDYEIDIDDELDDLLDHFVDQLLSLRATK